MIKGDIILLPFPFTDLSGLKYRPARILAVSENDVTVAFITTQFKWQDDFDVVIQPSPVNGLKKTSLIKTGKIATLDKDLVIGKLGKLSNHDLSKIDRNLLKIFQLDT
ncbi:MAG: type II toxin-antitoxin system PemK/MazF family toxin [Cyclobacteriaceae bacterium]|nr:type II toxin-antitoxin system PemK/MazF family toxin [Cyclobacteriaceae bacterium]MCX7636957.1 type II toxin-antitoxin system PemK/MazF family toxin [Cyclobacteriaceae bacterium]MDW8330474.1 type II toxin-antitoxin system PemK/MazF family toxin [Cyclobacteriaceae bacterium]